MHKYLLTLTEHRPRTHTIAVWADTPGEAVDQYMRPTAIWASHIAHAWDCPCTDRKGRQGVLKELLV